MIAEEFGEAEAFETIEDALSAALGEVRPDGGVVIIHDEDCALGHDEPEPCDCVPIELKRGAQA